MLTPAVVAVAVPLAYFALQREYVPYLSVYIDDARAAEVAHEVPPKD